ncbi:MAG: hypothetical protein AAF752_10065, partial [Bacteroidota bacterium]
MAKSAGQDTLRTALSVKALPLNEAQAGLPVRLRAPITFIDHTANLFFVQDSTDGVYIDAELPESDLTYLEQGDFVDIVGRTEPGFFAPIVAATRVQRIGTDADVMTMAVDPVVSDLRKGVHDARLARVRGQVRSGQFSPAGDVTTMSIIVEGQRMTLIFPYDTGESNPYEFVGCTIEVVGVVGATFNARRQIVGVNVMVQNYAGVRELKHARQNPFSVEAVAIGDLLKYSVDAPADPRRLVHGSVTSVRPSQLVIQSGTDAAVIELAEPLDVPIEVNDQVEAVGFPFVSAGATRLEDAVVRRTDVQSQATPRELPADSIFALRLDAILVRTEGTLLDAAKVGDETLLTVDAGTYILTASLLGDHELDHLKGARLALTGVSRLRRGMPYSDFHGEGPAEAERIDLLLRAESDLEVLRRPAWWTPNRVLWGMLIFGIVTVLAFTWGMSLRLRVEKQTGEIQRRLEAEELFRSEAEEAKAVAEEALA